MFNSYPYTRSLDVKYKASCTEDRLASVLTEVCASWMSDEYKNRYRAAIGNALRRMADNFVSLQCETPNCRECARSGVAYCPACTEWKCGDCGKTLSDEERGQFRCELCSMYPSPEATQ